MADLDPLDGPPTDGLEAAFRLPPKVEADPDMSHLHQEIVLRLRREAQGLPMNTVQLLLLERIATHYVTTKLYEEAGELTLRDMKDLNGMYLQMTAEFNRLLSVSQDKLRDALFESIQEIVMSAMNEEIDDKETHKKMRLRLAEEFAALDL